ncbi:hypothetical protein Hypma_011473 [Hypsizygus marmoreus]|uniref:Uncharacterized protein n=1 Tax=Hypsizygus marmoreus TaxID=39966 RepID=A0A369JRT0_HYPMA|nr:hypothetical protein Hypma_011473 [Hypsizygus marmoreus]
MQAYSERRLQRMEDQLLRMEKNITFIGQGVSKLKESMIRDEPLRHSRDSSLSASAPRLEAYPPHRHCNSSPIRRADAPSRYREYRPSTGISRTQLNRFNMVRNGLVPFPNTEYHSSPVPQL